MLAFSLLSLCLTQSLQVHCSFQKHLDLTLWVSLSSAFPDLCVRDQLWQSPCWHQYFTSKQWGSELAQVCLNSEFRCCPWPGHFGQSWLQVCICSIEALDFSQPEHLSGLPQVFYLNWDSAALNPTHPFYLCRGRFGNALCMGWLSQYEVFLSVACHFTFLSLSKICCQRWGRKFSLLPGAWCHLSQTGSCRLVGSTPHLLRSPNLSWLMNSLQNLLPSFLFHMFFCKNMTWYEFPETCLRSGRSNALEALPPWATNWFLPF